MRFRRKKKPPFSEARKIRRRVDIEDVLRRLRIEFKRRDDDLYSVCPNPEHKDRDPSWHIRSVQGDMKNGVFNCWSCKWSGDIYSLVSKLRGVDFAGAVAFVKASMREAATIAPAEISDDDYLQGMQPAEPPEIGFFWPDERGVLRPFTPKPIRFDSDCAVYLRSRWIGSQYVERHGLLDWQEKRRIIVPILRRGRMISWVARSYVGASPKTFAPKGAPKRWEIFGLDLLDHAIAEVNIVEGWVDQIRLSQIGVQNALAICGSTLTEPQVEEIVFARRVIVWMDGDKAGEVLAEDVAGWLGYERELMIVEMPEGKDPGDYSPVEISNFQARAWDHKRRRQCHQ